MTAPGQVAEAHPEAQPAPSGGALPGSSLRERLNGRMAGTFGVSGILASPVISEAECTSLVNQALRGGFSVFDTAPSYGNGEGERRLGHALKGQAGVFVMTKAGLGTSGPFRRSRDFSPENITASVRASATRLGRTPIDLLWLHGPGRSEVTQELVLALQELKQVGLVSHFGIAGRTSDLLAALDHPLFEAVMLPINMYADEPCRNAAQAARINGRIVFGIETLRGQLARRISRASLWRAAARLKSSAPRPASNSGLTAHQSIDWALDTGGADFISTTTTVAAHLAANAACLRDRRFG